MEHAFLNIFKGKSLSSSQQKMCKNNITKGAALKKIAMEEYTEFMWCHYCAFVTTGTTNIKRYSQNSEVRRNINPNTLENQRRFIVKQEKLRTNWDACRPGFSLH